MANLARFMRLGGEKFEVHRNNEKISEVEGLPNHEEATKKAYIGFEPHTNIEVGDWLVGMLSNNYFYIEDIKSDIVKGAVFQLKGYYLTKIEYEEKNKKREGENESITNIYNLNGANAKINNHSLDYSINVIDMSSGDLFDEIKKVLNENITDKKELDSLKETVDEMEINQETSKFNESYTKFITSAANHVTILAPFIPALTQMITSGL